MLIPKQICVNVEKRGGTYDSHVVEADGGAVHADAEEGHEDTHVEPRAGETLEDGAGVGLESTLALGHSVPTMQKQHNDTKAKE